MAILGKPLDISPPPERFPSNPRTGAGVAWVLSGNLFLGLILALAMVINLLVAAIAATLIPIGLRALKIDPALASAVFITTLTDVFGFFAFLGLATIFLEYLEAAT